MARPELVACGAAMKQQVANQYSCNGASIARTVARRWIAGITEGVSEVEGKRAAAGLLFDVQDSLLADVPPYDFTRHAVTEDEASEAEHRAWFSHYFGSIRSAATWWLVGVITSPIPLGLARWAFGW